MSENLFLSALQRITAGSLTLGDLIEAATGLTVGGETKLAAQLYKIWINFNPEHPQLCVVHFNCSVLQSAEGDREGALESLRAALALNADFMPAYINIGGLLEQMGALDEALEQWNVGAGRLSAVTGRSIGYKLAALKQMARVLGEHRRIEAAEGALRQALDIAPDQRDVIEQYIALRLGLCKWPVIAPWEEMDRKALVRGIHPLSLAAYSDDPLLQLGIAANYIERVVPETPDLAQADRRHAPIDLAARRLRIGYVSSDLRDHAVGYLMSEVFELHDKNNFEVFAYYSGPASSDPLQLRTKAAVEHWADIRNLSDDAAATLIAADGIDILVDVNGHTRDAKTGVFARRPAPIQVNWLGYPGTMGSPYHDYLIGDDWITPPESELYYSEKVVRLPCYQPNDRKRVVAAERPTRRDAGLPDGAFVFCCFNGTQKISRFTFERWIEILKRVPDSVLWMLEGAPDVNARLADLLEQGGVSRNRLIFAPKQANPLHLARYPLADLFVDTSPYGAHTTASDALWMGVPVLTLSGRSFASRVCGSLVKAAGLNDLVVSSPAEYVERAVALAGNRAEIEAYKVRLEMGRATCDLFNMDKLVSSLEELYRGMCAERAQGQMPQPRLANLESYLRVGVELDHDAVEMTAVEDYLGLYKGLLARRHRARPMEPDGRLWTAEDIAAIDGRPLPEVVSGMAPRRRRTGGE